MNDLFKKCIFKNRLVYVFFGNTNNKNKVDFFTYELNGSLKKLGKTI